MMVVKILIDKMENKVVLLLIFVSYLFISHLSAQVSFSDVTKSCGIKNEYKQTYGIAWGDFNGDGLIDVWVNNHYDTGILYKNTGSWFVDCTKEMNFITGKKDSHGVQWADFDNDGDLDLIQLVGGGRGIAPDDDFYGNMLMVNYVGKKLVDEAKSRGLLDNQSRARSPLWVDVDNDGDLDLYECAIKRPDGISPSTIFINKNGKFQNIPKSDGFTFPYSDFNILTDVDNDIKMEILLGEAMPLYFDTDEKDKQKLLLKKIPIQTIKKNLQAKGVSEIISGDFNGDCINDLFVIRPSGMNNQELLGDSLIMLQLRMEEGTPDTVCFRAETDFSIVFEVAAFKHKKINFFRGNQFEEKLQNVEQFQLKDSLKYVLSPSGEKREGVTLSYVKGKGVWQFSWFSSTNIGGGVVSFNGKFSNFQRSEEMKVVKNNCRLFLGTADSGYVEKSIGYLSDSLFSASGGVMSDFDNDGDLDIYLVKLNNYSGGFDALLINNGKAEFELLTNPGELEYQWGMTGPVSYADYNNDGFIDLLIAKKGQAHIFINTNQYFMLKNNGNGNNWLKICLKGKSCNRDGIGSTVVLYANGKAQLREQNGGMQNDVQNDNRIHFGLGSSMSADSIVIYWSDNKIQKIGNAKANQILTIQEN